MSSSYVYFCIFALALIYDCKASFYQGWKTPEYCASIDYVTSSTKIPMLQQKNLILAQAQVLARHGARAPYYRVYCWDKAKSPVDTRWNCSNTAVVSQDIVQVNAYGRLYKKAYTIPHNILTGTCPVGGLLPLGRVQHHANGRLLRDAYLGKTALHLFPTTKLSEIPMSDIYLRSDDEERTLASGQSLVDGMFEPEGDEPVELMRTWHTADESTDIVNANAKVCPGLDFITSEAVKDASFSRFITSNSAVNTQNELEALVGKVSWSSVLECLMIARCNDIALPDGFTESLFDRTIQQVESREFLKLTYNDAKYAKTSMAPLMNEFLRRMDARVRNVDDAPKLAIVIGHDSTLMPMLAALLGDTWDGKWVPYAAMLVMELYREDGSSRHFVRLLYKGQPLVIPGCPSDVCEYKLFRSLVAFGLKERDCSIPSTSFTTPITTVDGTADHSRILQLCFVLLLGNACLVFLYHRRHSRIDSAETNPLL